MYIIKSSLEFFNNFFLSPKRRAQYVRHRFRLYTEANDDIFIGRRRLKSVLYTMKRYSYYYRQHKYYT